MSQTELSELLSAISVREPVAPSDKQGDLHRRAVHAMRGRECRRSLFPEAVLRDSCWEIMLLCFIGQLEGRQLCVKQIRNQLDESNTALLRRIDELEAVDMLRRKRDDVDGRRTMLRLTDGGMAAMLRYFERSAAISAT